MTSSQTGLASATETAAPRRLSAAWPAALLLCCLCAAGRAAEGPPPALPAAGWQQPPVKVEGLEGEYPVVVAHPADQAAALEYQSEEAYEPGLYRLHLRLIPSHTHGAIAWRGGVNLQLDRGEVLPPVDASAPEVDRAPPPATLWSGIDFCRVNHPETKTVRLVLPRRQRLRLRLSATVDHDTFETVTVQARHAASGESLPDRAPALEATEDDGGLEMLQLEEKVSPGRNFYYAVESLALERLSGSAFVVAAGCDKIRYRPEETLRGWADLRAASTPAAGTLQVFLEHGVAAREMVLERPVTLREAQARLTFEVPLPARELGHAVVARFVGEDGADASEAAEYFNIARNPYRVAIIEAHPVHNQTFGTREGMAAMAAGLRREYKNLREIFFWAEEDMVELSPEEEYWFSGQTAYHMRKEGLLDLIQTHQAVGIAMTTYSKFVMSGYLGWRQAYEHPNDNKRQYGFCVGMWAGSDVPALDRFGNKEFIATPPQVGGVFGGNLGGIGYVPFLPINPDATPRNVRLAAEEMLRSIRMFGWDGCRWDGHPRGASQYGNSCGGDRPEKYNRAAHRRTQLLVRYFKDIVAAEFPDFQHGYNYLGVQTTPAYDWAVEDFELDELSRGGGLLMNEQISNHTNGWSLQKLAANIQVEGDLAREHGGCLLGIGTKGVTPRDELAETVLWYAGGMRSYGAVAENRRLNRYATRFSRYVFDETLTRLAEAEAVLAPAGETRLWWRPFVYETAPAGAASQLVVNLMNLDPAARVAKKGAPDGEHHFPPGTDEQAFGLTLPAGYACRGGRWIDPFSLRVTPAALADGRLTVPPVNLWRVLVLDLEREEGVATLAERYGPPSTADRRREGDGEVDRSFDPLDLHKDVVDVNKNMASRFPEWGSGWWEEPQALQGLSLRERNAWLLERQKEPAYFLDNYPGGLGLPADLKLQEAPPDFGDLTPVRDGVADIFYARGSLDGMLRLHEAFARLPRVRFREARFTCSFGPGGYRLENNLAARELGDYDVLVYCDIPHPAVGVQQSYAMLDYVRRGGGVLFTGGEYAFEKGRYGHTVLDRELLPVRCAGTRNNIYSREPIVMEPGPDFAELGVTVDFAAEPAVFCWNQTPLRPAEGVKIFLQSGNRPLLVGWELGEGRVACLLAMHKGHSGEGATAFFDWEDWPRLAAAVLRWLAPAAGTTVARPVPVSDEEVARLRNELEASAMDDLLDAEMGAEEDMLAAVTDAETDFQARARELEPRVLNQRVLLVRRLVRSGREDVGGILAEQLATVSNLPETVRFRIIDYLRVHPPEDLAAVAQRCVTDKAPAVRGAGYQLLALAQAPRFAELLTEPPQAMEVDPVARRRYLVLGLPFYGREDLQARGRELVERWNREEAATIEAYTDGEGFSLAAPEVPCLASEDYFARVGWLAYLSRFEPARYARQLARQWALLPQHGDFCDRGVASVDNSMRQGPKTPASIRAAKERKRELYAYKEITARLFEALAPRLQTLLRAESEAVLAGLRRCHFRQEAVAAMNLLGPVPPAELAPGLPALEGARQPLLGRFVKARLPGREEE
jgi:hypothetical protein